MSQATAANAPPEFNLADRMRKAQREAGIGVQEMADQLGVQRGTVSRWINGVIRPSVPVLTLWAQMCGVSYDWLVNG
jgi:transcriptional regulator with XRE-family HTH domain